MKLQSPFCITPRLAPGLKIQDSNGCAWVSFDKGRFIIDLPDGTEHKVTDFSFPQGRIAGDTDETALEQGFAAILGFLGACAESRAYAVRRGKEPMDGENAALFPDNVGTWAESVSDELSMLAYEIEDKRGELITH